jgi:signal transduction histidine kinase
VQELVDAFNRMSQELFEYNKVRDEFVANASHELKTPLTAIKILSEAILSLENPKAHADRMIEFMKDIDAEVDRLNHIITRLLEIARENDANLDMELKYFDLRKLVDVIVHRVAPIAMQKKLAMKISADREVKIFADEHRIDRAITNLVDNAIKYTDNGSVEVEVRHNNKYAIVRVRDTGVGIPEASRAHVFDRFYRVDKARSRAKGGTGLGLSLVNDIVKAHGGYITLDSELGVGSTFTVYLPLTK